jgi:hypothetical protein
MSHQLAFNYREVEIKTDPIIEDNSSTAHIRSD